MNYLRQLNRFYQQLPTAGLSSQAVCLYGVLLHVNNQCYWKPVFSVANGTLMGLCHLTERALRQARGLLVAGEWITYQSRNGQRAGLYAIRELEAQGYEAAGGASPLTVEATQAGAVLHAYNRVNTEQTTPQAPQGGKERTGRRRNRNPALRYTQRSPEELAQYDDGIVWL